VFAMPIVAMQLCILTVLVLSAMKGDADIFSLY
jgi:hypothetical protein